MRAYQYLVNKVTAVTAEKQEKEVRLLTQDRFVALTDIVIKEFESGYYHPSWLPRFNAADQKTLRYSGETMYGLDRKAGAALAKYPEWKQFWAIIDGAEAKKYWKHYYLGGRYAPQLRKLASIIMYKWFSELFKKYVFKAGAEAVANDDRLIIHFSYACWNGSGWFLKFANALNAVVKKTDDKEVIFLECLMARVKANNPTIRQGGEKMMKYFSQNKEFFL